MLRTHLVLSHVLSLVIWLNLYRNYNMMLASVAPPFYYNGADIWVTNNDNIRNTSTCNGLWSCAKLACQLYQATGNHLDIMPFGEYDNTSCSTWGTLEAVPAYQSLLKYGVFYTLLADLFCLLLNIFSTILIWNLLPKSYNNNDLIEITPPDKYFRITTGLYAIIFSLIKLLSIVVIICNMIFSFKIMRLSGDYISRNIDDMEMSINIVTLLIITAEYTWTFSKFIILMCIHQY